MITSLYQVGLTCFIALLLVSLVPAVQDGGLAVGHLGGQRQAGQEEKPQDQHQPWGHWEQALGRGPGHGGVGMCRGNTHTHGVDTHTGTLR